MGGRSCPAVGTKARQRCEAWRAIASEMNFTPELCRMSAGCGSLVYDNHTRQHRDVGERVWCCCVRVDIHVMSACKEKWRKERRKNKVPEFRV